MAAGYTPRIGLGSQDVCPNWDHTGCRAIRELIAGEYGWCRQPLGEHAAFISSPTALAARPSPTPL
jgi:hypothetical protein